jgi:riboflavin synthase
MFTGIIEEIGRIATIERHGENAVVRIQCNDVLADSNPGDSIAVDGVCLTVEKMDGVGFSASATSETLSRSTFGSKKAGQSVNLERALKASGRLGGHIVQGHIDSVAEIIADRPVGNALIRTFKMDRAYSKYVVEKGSVSIDGVSLTVSEKSVESFSVALIPETVARTTISEKRPGDKVNIEVDILAKYVESLMNNKSGSLTMDKLRESGF